LYSLYTISTSLKAFDLYKSQRKFTIHETLLKMQFQFHEKVSLENSFALQLFVSFFLHVLPLKNVLFL